VNKNKLQKAEEFIGWKSEDGLLEVVDIHGKQGTIATFKVICHKCKEDKELFPLGYFVSAKGSLVRRQKPCGCAFNPKWNKDQFLVLASRAAQGHFVVHGFAEEFHGNRTKLNLECLADGYKWTASIHNIINKGSGCPKCQYDSLSDNQRTDEQEALDNCKTICEIEGYEVIGFPDGYKNNTSRFEYKCQKHEKQNVSYYSFVNGGRRCKECYKDRQKEVGNGYGYYPDRKDEKDFLYVLDFDNKFLKVGRSFDVKSRISQLKHKSNIKKIHKLRIFTASHQEIYDLEQKLHSELRERNFQHCVGWSKECFENECLFILNKLLDNCRLEEIGLNH